MRAAARGLYYPPDPAGMDQSTIGGNAATDAGGPACVKYGTTRDYILGLEAVLPDGSLLKTGVATRKGVVGYDLTNLLVGSEGTLGIITPPSLFKLLPQPAAKSGLLAVFPGMSSAMNAVAEIMGHGYLPAAIEFLDHKCLSLVGDMLPFRCAAGDSVLIIETDGPREQVTAEIQGITETGATGWGKPDHPGAECRGAGKGLGRCVARFRCVSMTMRRSTWRRISWSR